jgi:4a-hydroxytetrahydrobiopterin dehydratase
VSRPGPLTGAEVAAWLAGHSRWRLQDGQLVAELDVTYDRGIEILRRTSGVVGSLNHHPRATIEYHRLRVELSTHDVGAVTRLDVELAEAFDEATDRSELS